LAILDYVSSSTTKVGIRIVIAGLEKVGKTTLAANAPRPLLVPLEAGYAGVNIQKTPKLTTFVEIMQLMDEIIASAHAGKFPFQSLIFDSATALEIIIHEAVLARDPMYSPGNKKTVTMDSALGGYGKAFAFSNELFQDFLRKCDILSQTYCINIVLTCHVFAAKMLDPMNGEYDSWDLLLHSPKNQKTYGKREMITQWADIVGFLYEPMYIAESKTVTKGISANKGRILALNRSPSYVAGNRFAVTTDIPIPAEKGWNYLADAVYKGSSSAGQPVDIFNRD
jgi:AAA domain